MFVNLWIKLFFVFTPLFALGTRGITILSRLTGLTLSALAAQMFMTGIQASKSQ